MMAYNPLYDIPLRMRHEPRRVVAPLPGPNLGPWDS